LAFRADGPDHRDRGGLLPVLGKIALFIANTASNAASLWTFDELATPEDIPGLNYSTIPNGYGGLSWFNFGVLDGAIRPASEGYHTGLVSPNNVAFNLYGEPASISLSGGVFDLHSAYLALALNLDTPLNVQVQGLVGTTLLYDNTYTVYRSAPTPAKHEYGWSRS
jgi:cyclic lactone autoinducer peptide